MAKAQKKAAAAPKRAALEDDSAERDAGAPNTSLEVASDGATGATQPAPEGDAPADPGASPFTAKQAAERLGVTAERLAEMGARVGVAAECVFAFREYPDRTVVVTIDGRKLSDGGDA